MKKLKVFLLSVVLLMAMTFNVFAGEFASGGRDANGEATYLYIDDGIIVKNRWVQNFEGKWYYCGEDGYLLRNTGVEIDNKWYYFGDDWAMLADTTTPDGYYVGADGAWVPEAGEAQEGSHDGQ